MKLTILRLTALSGQDIIDLGKIWPEYSADTLLMDDTHLLYAAQFNERLLGAVRVTINGQRAMLDSLRIRELTRRRGVGQYLIEEILARHPRITQWQVSDQGVEDHAIMTAFMQSLGFRACEHGWQR
ncbi:aspartate 1-decarboxylase autocleavage activator PanM [Shimwellia pseudoproteus]|uniref:aspartate 1-decarboxylase autocleavage activator PanM n=1 Tax=Shimwellia pseudoproteus TaxID=570012 RepID=UPI0018ED9E38|nr:aspartate 1-decarboxylase autocleavage activator PanM [Shimwellia pseudoproteus]MBJ3815646.1 aspartate 1-decarboxylase autocleavage activator PanM [Shimwellia pseudoproteus]